MTRQELELLLKIRTDGEQSFTRVSAGVQQLTKASKEAAPAIDGVSATARAEARAFMDAMAAASKAKGATEAVAVASKAAGAALTTTTAATTASVVALGTMAAVAGSVVTGLGAIAYALQDSAQHFLKVSGTADAHRESVDRVREAWSHLKYEIGQEVVGGNVNVTRFFDNLAGRLDRLAQFVDQHGGKIRGFFSYLAEGAFGPAGAAAMQIARGLAITTDLDTFGPQTATRMRDPVTGKMVVTAYGRLLESQQRDAATARVSGMVVGLGDRDSAAAIREMDEAEQARAKAAADALKESARQAKEAAKAMKAAWQEWYEGILLGRRAVLEAQQTVAKGPWEAYGAEGFGAFALTLPRLTPEGWNMAPLNKGAESWAEARARLTPSYGKTLNDMLAMGTMSVAELPTVQGLSPDEVAAIRARGPAFSWLGLGGALATAGVGAAMGGGSILDSLGFTASNQIVDWFSQQGGLTGLAQGVGGLAAGLGGFMTGRSVTQQSGSRLIGGLAGAGTGALSGFAAGGPIGAVVGGLAGAVGSLFGPSKGAIEGKQADADIQALQKGLLDTYGSLDKIREMGQLVGVDLAAAWGDKNKAGLAHFTGLMQEFEDRVTGLERATAQYGLTWKELGPQMQAAKVKEVSQGLIDDYENMTRAGIDNEVAVRRMAPALNDLIAKAIESGQTVPAALVPILDQLEEMGLVTQQNALALAGLSDGVTVDFRQMADVAAEYGIELGALGEKFQQARLHDAARQILEDFTFLTDSGADVGGVLAGMSDEISQLVQDSEQFGVAIPENMRPLIEQLIESGQLLDENGEKITDIGELEFAEPITAGFDRIVETLRVDVVGAIRDLIGVFRDDLPAGAKAGADGIREEFRDFRIRIPVEYDYDELGELGPSPAAPRPGSANGILTTYPTLRWFGEREPEMGGTVEFMTKALAGAIHKTGGGTLAGGLGGPTPIILKLNDRVLGEVLVDVLPEILRRRGLL